MAEWCKDLSIAEVADFLKAHDNYTVLTHASPDGDTLGSGWALVHLLRQMGKQANLRCPDPLPRKFSYLTLPQQTFAEQTVVAVDVADDKLLGGLKEEYAQRVELCIDHHVSNVRYAKRLFLNADAAAACECIYALAQVLGAPITPWLASALYTGISTDTGCFRFSNTTANTLRIAADLLEQGADTDNINRVMFETKSRAHLEMERLALEGMEFCFAGKCAILVVTTEMLEQTGCEESDMDGISAIPRTVEGVLVGVTLRQKGPDVYKASVRSHAPIDAQAICKRLGGGGHIRAAGCQIKGDAATAKAKMLEAVKKQLEEQA